MLFVCVHVSYLIRSQLIFFLDYEISGSCCFFRGLLWSLVIPNFVKNLTSPCIVDATNWNLHIAVCPNMTLYAEGFQVTMNSMF